MARFLSSIKFLLLISPLVAAILFFVVLWQTKKLQSQNEAELTRISGVDLEALEKSYSLVNILADTERRLVESIGNADKEELVNVETQKKTFLDVLQEIAVIEPKFEPQVNIIQRAFSDFIEKSLKITNILVDNKMEEFGFDNFHALMTERNNHKEALSKALAALKLEAQESIDTRIKSALESGQRNLKSASMASYFALAVLLALYLSMYPFLISPLSRLVGFTRRIGGGDFTGQVDDRSQNEVGNLARAFNEMMSNFRAITSQIKNSNQEILGSAKDILSAAVQQSTGSTEQAAAINETSATVNELKETSRQSEQRAQEVVETAARSVEYSKRGRLSVQETVKGMIAIQEQVQAIAANIMSLSERTEAIIDIIQTVNEIAEQSNVLAVNASIEAAKAGEYGRGFEVVAREVKSMADQSKNATGQVRMLLTEIKKATAAAVMASEEGERKAEQGSQLVQVAGENIDHLSEVIEESARAAKQIAITSHQQSVGIDQIAIAIENIRQTTSENVASVRQTENAAQGLTLLAEKMKGIVAKYKVE